MKIIAYCFFLSGFFLLRSVGNALAVPAKSSSDVAQVVSKMFPGFRMLQKSDYVPVLKEEDRGGAQFKADFNRDGKDDLAVLLINDSIKEYRIYYLIAKGGDYNATSLYTRKWNKGEAVRTPMFFKPAGEAGMANRDHNSLVKEDDPLETREQKKTPYKSAPAIEVWTGTYGDERDGNLESMAYCSMTWYFEKGQLKMFDACD